MTFTVHAPPSEAEAPLSLTLEGQPQFSIDAVDYDVDNVDEMIAKIKHNGCVRVKGFLTPDEIKAAEVAVRPALDAAQYAGPEDQTKRLGRLPQHAPALTTRILTDKVYTGVMDKFLSVRHTSWLGTKKFVVEEKPIVAMSSIFEVGPGMKVQDLHRDDAIWYSKKPEIRPEDYAFGRDYCISFFVAGTRTTRANGATRVVPGSHLNKYDAQPDTSKAVDAELDAGDAFFMLSSVYHGAGENSTVDEKRLVYAMFSQQPHLRQVIMSRRSCCFSIPNKLLADTRQQEENLTLCLDLNLVRSYPLEVQRRLGYDVALPNLGWVDHASPLESVLKQKGADNRTIPGYNPVEGVADKTREA